MTLILQCLKRLLERILLAELQYNLYDTVLSNKQNITKNHSRVFVRINIMACRWCNPFFLLHDSCTLLLVHNIQNVASAPGASPPWERRWAFPFNIWALSYYTTAVETSAVSQLCSQKEKPVFCTKGKHHCLRAEKCKKLAKEPWRLPDWKMH